MSYADGITAYTDGSVYPNPNGDGGWGMVAYFGNKMMQKYGYIPNCTSNLAELTAIREVLLRVKLTEHPLTIHTDSQYCNHALNRYVNKWKVGGWRNAQGKKVTHKGIIEEIDGLFAEHRKYRDVRLLWTKGHCGNPMNDMAHALASMGRTRQAGHIPFEEIF